MREFSADCEEFFCQGRHPGRVIKTDSKRRSAFDFWVVFLWLLGQALRGAYWKSLQLEEAAGTRGRSIASGAACPAPLHVERLHLSIAGNRLERKRNSSRGCNWSFEIIETRSYYCNPYESRVSEEFRHSSIAIGTTMCRKQRERRNCSRRTGAAHHFYFAHALRTRLFDPFADSFGYPIRGLPSSQAGRP